MKELIKQILKEEVSLKLRRMINFNNMNDFVKKLRIINFKKDQPIKNSVIETVRAVALELMGNKLDELSDEEYWEEYDKLKKFINDLFEKELTEYFEKRKKEYDEETNPLNLRYVFVKHDKPYYDIGWRGFTEGFNSFDDMITKYGNWVDVDWDEIKKKLDTINDFPDNQFNGWYYSRPLRIKSVGEEGNKWGYNFSVIKSIPYENLDKIIKESKDPKVGTGKKPEGSDRRLYTDENPSDTVSVKFRTKQDIVDTLNKESFKSKSHARQSQIINLIHQRLRVALERAKDPEVKKRLRTAFEYIESKKEQSKNKTKEMKERLHDTSWENDEGNKITLMDLLNATEDIPVENISVEALKPHLLTWDGDEDEIKKIESSDLQYPILIFVDNGGEFISIIDGHHRAQKAVRKGLETIKAKIIPINSLPKNIRKVFSHMGKQEQTEGELTERCWKGYTQKGMKTMFGKRYPNCVKIKK